MWEMNCEESWAPENWCFWTVVLEKTLESPLDCKDIQPVHSEGDQPWDFFGRNDAKAETPVVWPPHAKSWLIGKDSDAGRDWEPEEKGTTVDEMAEWQNPLDRQKFEWTPGSWWWTGRPDKLQFMRSQRVGHDWATELNWTELKETKDLYIENYKTLVKETKEDTNRWRNSGRLYFTGLQKSLQMVTTAMKLRHLLLGRKVMTNLDSIIKGRDITLPIKVCLVKAVIFPVVMYGCESWTAKKAECQRIDAFELRCWRRLLRVPWTARRSALGFLWKEWC